MEGTAGGGCSSGAERCLVRERHSEPYRHHLMAICLQFYVVKSNRTRKNVFGRSFWWNVQTIRVHGQAVAARSRVPRRRKNCALAQHVIAVPRFIQCLTLLNFFSPGHSSRRRCSNARRPASARHGRHLRQRSLVPPATNSMKFLCFKSREFIGAHLAAPSRPSLFSCTRTSQPQAKSSELSS